jgi:GrpB-like predicted nucleotidyltransferase (UPF0157 family)
MSDDAIELEPHDPEWHDWYETEALELIDVVDAIQDVAHVGSTAVPGLIARPVVDIAVGVEPLEAVSRCVVAMQQRGYEYLGEAGVKGRFYFRKRGERDIDVSMMRHKDKPWRRHLAFRDHLRDHPEVAERYGSLKKELAAEGDPDAYEAGKADFIEAILEDLPVP